MSTTTMTPSLAIADAMKSGAERAELKPIVAGLDGQGWALKCRTLPMCTLPPGAGALVVKYFSEQRPVAAMNHLRSARSVAHAMLDCEERRSMLNAIDAALNLVNVGDAASDAVAAARMAEPASTSLTHQVEARRMVVQQHHAHQMTQHGYGAPLCSCALCDDYRALLAQMGLV